MPKMKIVKHWRN